MVLDHQFVRRDAHMECIHFGPADAFLFAFFLCAVIGEYFEAGTPFLEFHLPIEHHRRWDNDQMRSPVAFDACQMGEQRNRLDGFTQTHLVGQNSVQIAVVHCDQPIKTYVLRESQEK